MKNNKLEKKLELGVGGFSNPEFDFRMGAAGFTNDNFDYKIGIGGFSQREFDIQFGNGNSLIPAVVNYEGQIVPILLNVNTNNNL